MVIRRAISLTACFTTIALSTSGLDASQRRAELVPFREIAEGVVIDVGPAIAKPALSDPMEQGLSPEMLRAEFRDLGPPAPIQSAELPSLPIAIPLWMQTGRVTTEAAQIAQSVFAPSMYRPAACSITPYSPRGDLTSLQEARRARYFPLISAVACEAGVPTGLLDALVAQESRYDPLIVSPKGAVGLTQLMPATARGLGVFDSRDPLANLRGGAKYLRSHLDEFKRVDLALAAYNAGPGRVRTLGRIPPFRETIGYVTAIAKAWSKAATRAPLANIASSPGRQSIGRGRGVELLAYTSTRVPNPR